MRVVFAGTPQVAVATLAALLDSGHDVVGVITREPKRRGRSKALVRSEVGEFAAGMGLNVLESSRPGGEEELRWIKELDADLGVVVAYGALLSQGVLDATSQGWVNLHFSSLPDLRGAAPVQRAVIRGDQRIGCSVFLLERGMDTGPIYSTNVYDTGGRKSSGDILEELATLGAHQVVQVVDQIGGDTAVATPQDEGLDQEHVTFAPKLTKEDGFVDFQGSAEQVLNQIRGVSPEPGAWTALPDGRTMKIGLVEVADAAEVAPSPDETPSPGEVVADRHLVRVGCATGSVVLMQVAPAGKNWMRAQDWWRGARLEEGALLGRRVEKGTRSE